MRTRQLTAAAAAFVLALSVASCGGGDDQPETGAIPTPDGEIVPPSQPVQAETTSPDDSGSTSTDEDGSSGASDSPERTPSSDLIPSVAAKSSDLTNFSTALGAAGLTSTLDENGPYTVFAPNNDGFAKLGTRLDALLQPASKAELVNILSFHVVKGELKAKDLEDGDLLTSLQGTRLRVEKKGDTVTIGNSNGKAQIVSTDMVAGNGVIHVIDTVLAPKTK